MGYDIDVSVTDPIEPVVGIPEDPEAGIRDMLDDLDELINESGKIYGFGSQGEEVKEIQTILNEGFGKDVKVDGIYGQETKMAVEEVQAELGVTVDGIVGQETLEAMRMKLNLESKEDQNKVKYVNNSELDLIPEINVGLKDEQVIDSRIHDYDSQSYKVSKYEKETIFSWAKVEYESSYSYSSGKNPNVEIQKNVDESVTIAYQNKYIKLDNDGNIELNIPGLKNTSAISQTIVFKNKEKVIGVKQQAKKKVGDVGVIVENTAYVPVLSPEDEWVLFGESSITIEIGGVKANKTAKVYLRRDAADKLKYIQEISVNAMASQVDSGFIPVGSSQGEVIGYPLQEGSEFFGQPLLQGVNSQTVPQGAVVPGIRGPVSGRLEPVYGTY
ncbi:hypothetical protein BBF96_12190 [Anoxybacter fermentans]|uniref:Peptidoglycan binding-like domain-containing protein n=1 Tax=Anoxybacter fermentans TaxID=1323375 RepID=A0A3S9T0M2_9FIRM|nr:peptidoglycan-binding domain-containing protein [Anoxybacter fermentans]AZR74089.1 hypothetical protein BBF96_12190 [Anoxybacter fermentans]